MKELGFMEFKGFKGHQHYSSNPLLNAFLYANFHKNRSSKGMECMCYDDIGAIWLSGNFKPDHNTFWCFFKRNERFLRKVLFQVTFTSQMNGLLGLVLHVLDGTKIRAQISDNSGWHTKTLQKKLYEGIDEVMHTIETSGKSDDFEYHQRFCLN